jgi:uncharacterized membrane protein YfhO
VSKLKVPNYNPFKTIFINKDLNIVDNPSGEILSYSKNADIITAEVKMSETGLLVFSEIYYPNGWECMVNNRITEIFEINGLLRGIKLRKGINNIEMKFNPTDLKYSKIFSLLSFSLIGIGIVFGFVVLRKNDKK